jgi:hypothetical protein
MKPSNSFEWLIFPAIREILKIGEKGILSAGLERIGYLKKRMVDYISPSDIRDGYKSSLPTSREV